MHGNPSLLLQQSDPSNKMPKWLPQLRSRNHENPSTTKVMPINRSILSFLGWRTQGDIGPWTFYTSRRNHLVFFIKAPPLEPPSLMQTRQRNRFRNAGFMWQAMSPIARSRWQLAASRARLAITGYNLFTHYVTKLDDATIHTVERLSGLRLIPLTESPP